jgi:hypothetical protein
MSQYVGHSLDLMDTEQRQLGQMRIERQEEDLLYGTFPPGPAFPNAEQLFHEFEAAVEVQALHIIETLDATIAALGLHLQWPDVREPITVQDVQIWSDGTIRAGSVSSLLPQLRRLHTPNHHARRRRKPTVEQTPAADALQRPLRCGFRAQLRHGVRRRRARGRP